MPRPAAPFGNAWVALAVLAAAARCASVPAAPADPNAILGPEYPVAVVVSYPAALYHWIDSLAGTSRGKTVEGYRHQYEWLFGPFTDEDDRALADFARMREHEARTSPGVTVGGIPVAKGLDLLAVFMESPSVDVALTRLSGRIGSEDMAILRRALALFAPRYERVWQRGRIPAEFVVRVGSGTERLALARQLRAFAAFFGVPPDAPPRPRLVLVPVPESYGTHAQAVGPLLLMEVRQGDDLSKQASVIAHENAHLLWLRVGADRMERLERASAAAGNGDPRPWDVLHEALPTALGQGVVGRAFESPWSPKLPWYDAGEVDRCAKRILPLVDRALEGDGRFDEAFVAEAARLCGSP